MNTLKLFEPVTSVGNVEQEVLKQIAESAQVMVDVGARTDFEFATQKLESCRVILIEGNPRFAQILKIKKKILCRRSDRTITILNAFIDIEEKKNVYYFKNSQSMYQNVMRRDDLPVLMNIPSARLDSLLQRCGITTVDFMKIDIEGKDLSAILSLGSYVNSIRFLQFEFGGSNSFIGQNDKMSDYLEVLNPHFNLYLIKDENNPMFSDFPRETDLIVLNKKALGKVNALCKQYIGFNILCVSKRFSSEVPLKLIIDKI